MKASLVLHVFLVGLCQAHPPPDRTKQTDGVPVSQLRMLSLGLARLLHGVAETAAQMERQAEHVLAGLDRATNSLESLRKQSLQAGRTHKQVRTDLQIFSAKGDSLQRTVRDLQERLEDLEKEQGTMQYWTNWIHDKVRSLTQPGSAAQAQINTNSIKNIMDKQAKWLDSLTSEVSARDRLINRRLRLIKQLEKRVDYHSRQSSV
ncbi:uncharacterized protein LOC114867176 [Betta splendens]|uniref:Uncharacterized protein LOC114867176 n=1 Tax=Betta splendens TaxID=158456 RepID=A0A6P7NZQ5_BETSP|nr:uncharacterized protein LOC114867176 [Betta splendens]